MNHSIEPARFAQKLGIAILLVAAIATALMGAEAFATGGNMAQIDMASGFAQF